MEGLHELEALLASLQSGVLYEDASRRITHVNQAFCRIFGIQAPPSALIGADCLAAAEASRSLFADPDAFTGDIESAIAGGRTIIGHELVLADGRVLERDYVPVFFEDGSQGHLWNYRDVTDARRNLRELRALNEQLEAKVAERTRELLQSQKMEALGQLAGGVAHDFNNLLNVITGCADLLLRDMAREDPRRQRLTDIVKAADKGAALARQLLGFSRRQLAKPENLDLTAVVSEVEGLLQRLIGEDIDLVLDLEASLGRVEADRSQLEQVIVNLAVNARDAMPRGGCLTLKTGSVSSREALPKPCRQGGGAWVTLAVKDTGHGMPPETLARIFEPFFTTKQPGQGTGLGLATVHGIVERSGGFVDVQSEVGAGSTFTVYLPGAGAPCAGTAPAASVRQEVPELRGNETVLLVEDDAKLRDVLAETLRGLGYVVISAASPEEALAVARSDAEPVHLLLTDIVMPHLNGLELASEVRAERPETKVLFMSGYSEAAITRYGPIGVGAILLNKPFTVPNLLSCIRQVLDERGALDRPSRRA